MQNDEVLITTEIKTEESISKEGSEKPIRKLDRLVVHEGFGIFLTILIGFVSVFSALSIWQSNVFSSHAQNYQFSAQQKMSIASSLQDKSDYLLILAEFYRLQADNLIMDRNQAQTEKEVNSIDTLIVRFFTKNELPEIDNLNLISEYKQELIMFDSDIINSNERMNSLLERSPEEPDYDNSLIKGFYQDSIDIYSVIGDEQNYSFLLSSFASKWSFSAAVCAFVLFLLSMAAVLKKARIRMIFTCIGIIAFAGVFAYIAVSADFMLFIE